jgi:DNA ligase-associated metallophosphoesterase
MDIWEEIYNDTWILSSRKVAFVPKLKALFIADLHLGKLTHFRKAGIGIPRQGELNNFLKLQRIIDEYGPNSVYFLGDLFHSKVNSIWDHFRLFLNQNERINFFLVLGNHDSYVKDQFDETVNLCICQSYVLDKYILSHEPLDEKLIPKDCINICGHIHPAVCLKGSGKQKLIISCFLFKPNQLIMPAFGEFTGNFVVDTKESYIVVGLENDEIFRIN